MAAHTAIEVFFFRGGRNYGNRTYFPAQDRDLDPAEVLQAFIPQFYDDKMPPTSIFLSHDLEEQALIAEALSVKSDRKIEVTSPKRGDKKRLVDMASNNAREAIGRRLAGNRDPGKAAGRRRRRCSAWQSRRSVSRFTTTAISRAPTRWAR